MRHRLLSVQLSTALVLACGADLPARKTDPVRSDNVKLAEFPPHGPIKLRFSPPPPEGTLFQLQLRYEGYSETHGDAAKTAEPTKRDELVQLELDYRQVPIAAPDAGDFASSLVLDALRRKTRVAPPGTEHSLEIGDDRIRSQAGEKIEADLRGAQSNVELAPRSILARPFALLVSDAAGNPKDIALRGIPAAKRLLATLPIRDSIAFVQVAFPDHAVSAGATWTARRFFANPIGRLGVDVEIEYRLVGFEQVDGLPCARISLRGRRDGRTASSESPFSFDQLHFELEGDAWIDLRSGEVQRLRLDDEAAVTYRRSTDANSVRVRARYQGRASLERLGVATTSKLAWADGTKRFAAPAANTGK